MKRTGARQPSHTVDGKQNEQPYWCDPVPTRYRAPVSATVRAPEGIALRGEQGRAHRCLRSHRIADLAHSNPDTASLG
jgi:hypothetical protein